MITEPDPALLDTRPPPDVAWRRYLDSLTVPPPPKSLGAELERALDAMGLGFGWDLGPTEPGDAA